MTANTYPTNADRAAWANAAMDLFRQLTGCDEEDALCDLLCDLMHWSLQQDFDFTAALDRARHHYDAELLEELLRLPVPADATALVDAMLDIKRMASKHDDSGYDPYAILKLIEQTAIAVLAPAKGGAQ
jgi:hypothetical protein